MCCTRAPAAKQAAEVSRYRLPDARMYEAAARSFYEELLGGRQVWPTDHGERRDVLCFLIEQQLIVVCPARRALHEPLQLLVAAPNAIAERCWDAGFTVRVDGDREDGVLHVVDPFGRSIALILRREAEMSGAECAA
jgi:catechol 2,3-dioxygenase-like lactoylglutathione lyase family enzyme